MHLMYTLSPSGERIYTLKKVNHGEVTKSAHPARFSPDDKYSRYVSCSLNHPPPSKESASLMILPTGTASSSRSATTCS